jgi:hypothetical protein
MPIREVCSPVNSSVRNSKLSGGQPLSPGARSMPGRRADQTHEPAQEPTKARVSLGSGGEPAEVTVTGPQEKHGERPQERYSPEE